jgi:hypothetical protein
MNDQEFLLTEEDTTTAHLMELSMTNESETVMTSNLSDVF